MSEQILAILKRKLNDLSPQGGMDAEILRNALKEELQFYVLNFVYHHPEYNKWVMYGGSALRIIHGLDRMSVDLDFEVSDIITKKYLDELEEEIAKIIKSKPGLTAKAYMGLVMAKFKGKIDAKKAIEIINKILK